MRGSRRTHLSATVGQARPRRAADDAPDGRRTRRWRPLLAPLGVVALAAAVTALNIAWSTAEARPPYWDMAGHLQRTLVYRSLLQDHELWEALTAYGYYPPLVYWVTMPFYWLFGPGKTVAVASVNAVFVTLLVLGTYGIGAYLWSRRVGLLSALVIAGAPLVVSTSKEYAVDMPLTAMCAVGLYLLLRTEAFTDRRYSLLFGAACGLGMLTKWTYALAFAVPVGLLAVRALVDALRRRDPARLANVALAGLVAFLLCGYWYVTNLDALRTDFEIHGAGGATREGDPAVASISSVKFYAWSLVNDQLALVLTILFVVGLVVMARRRDALRRNRELLVYLAGGYLAFTLLRNKEARYAMPLLVAAVPICLYWIELVSRRALQRAVVAGVALYSAAVFLLTSFGSGPLPRDVRIDAGSASVVVFRENPRVYGPPSSDDWRIDDVVRTVRRQAFDDRSVTYAGPDTIWMSYQAWQYLSALRGVRFEATVELLPKEKGISHPATTTRYVAVRGARPTGLGTGLSLVRRYTLPDGTTLELLRRGTG